MSLSFVLVTQADGSARRFPFVNYAIAVALVVAFTQWQGGTEFADRARADAVDYLHENPYVEVDTRYEVVIPPSYAEALHEEYFAERAEQGLPPISDFLIERSQGEFVDLLAYALSKVRALPLWRYGIESTKADPIDWLAHVAVHETSAALWISLFFLLCLGIALEDAWGAFPFLGLALTGTLATAYASAALGYTETMGLPWFGASGLIATLLGAHFIRSFRAAPLALSTIPLPGWLMLPAWIAADTMMIRGVSSADAFEVTPLVVQATGFGVGALVAVVMAALKFEARQLDAAAETEELVSNPVLERAMAAKEAGRLEQSFDMLRAEYRRNPDNRDVALALWDASLSVGKAPRVVDAILRVIEQDLQAGHTNQAVSNWFSMTDEVENAQAPAPVLVRMGEALLDEGHPESAVAALQLAIHQKKPLPTALAQRIVRVARDLDPELTRSAAQIALRDPLLGGAEREELARLSDEITPAAAKTTAAAAPSPDTRAPSLDLEVSASPAPANESDEFADLDPQAISLDDPEPAAPAADDLEAWNDPSLLTDLDSDLSEEPLETDLTADLADGDLEGMEDAFDDLDDDALAQAAFDAGAIETDELDLSIGGVTATQPGVPSVIPRADETVTEVVGSPRDDDETTTVVNVAPALRDSQVRDAIPVRLEPEAIVIEVEGGKKTRLPYTRIEAISAAAVKGMGERPIVVIDFALNWQTASQPLKSIRMRSDRFDPAALVPDQPNQLAALQKLLSDLVEKSGATPLPNFNAATGTPFAVCDGLEIYAREVLGTKQEG